MVVQRAEKDLGHVFCLIQNLLKETTKPHFVEAVSMLLAALAEHTEESVEAFGVFVEWVACNLDQLRKVLVRNIVYEDLSFFSQSCNNGGCETEWGRGERFQYLLLIFLKSFEEP